VSDEVARALQEGVERNLIPTARDAAQAVAKAIHSVADGAAKVAERTVDTEARLVERITAAGSKDADAAATRAEMSAEQGAERSIERRPAIRTKISGILDPGGPGAHAVSGEDRRALLDELARNGVKHDPDSVVRIARGDDGQIKFLERGDDKAGLSHVERHTAEFETLGISREEIPDFAMTAATKGRVIGYQGKGTGRPIMEFDYHGETYHLATTVGSNGYVVGANPVSSKPKV
jgi:hypothetical protein